MEDIFHVATGSLSELAVALLGGENNIIERLIFHKIEEVGKEKIEEVIKKSPVGEGLGTAKRVEQVFKTGGESEFHRLRNQWLNSIKRNIGIKTSGGSNERISKKIAEIVNNVMQQQSDAQSRPESGHWNWSKSRMEWMSEDWRHDWRSQPRDIIGRWLPGRLGYIFISHKAKKIRSARRRAVRKSVREMMRS